MTYNFSEQLEKNEREYGMNQSSDNFEIKEGNNNICRILTPGAVYATHYIGTGVKSPVCYGYEKGCPIREKDKEGDFTTVHAKTSIKYVHFVLDRIDNKVKTAFLPYSVYKQVAALQKNPDYSFDDLPMPYDIRITYNRQADNNSKYRVEYKPNSPELTESNLTDLADKMSRMTPEAIVERMKQKQVDDDEKNGRRMSTEQITTNNQQYLKKAIEQDTESRTSLPAQPYPESINPEDIPF